MDWIDQLAQIVGPENVQTYLQQRGMRVPYRSPDAEVQLAPGIEAPQPLEPGNIDLGKRPVVRNPDGSISTVRSMSFGEGNRETLVPTIGPQGQQLTPEQAVQLYRQTGQHLGQFPDPATANAYAQQLHQQQAQMYGGMPQIQPQMAQGAPNAPQQGVGYDQLQQAALRSMQPQQQQPQTWGDIGKQMIVPLGLGLLTALGSPRRRGVGASIATGAVNAFNAYELMKQHQAQQQVAQQRAQMAQAGMLSRLAQGAATQQYRQQQLAGQQARLAETTDWHDILKQHYQDVEARQEKQMTLAERRESRLAEMDKLTTQLREAQLSNIPLKREETEARLRKLQAEEGALNTDLATRKELADSVRASGVPNAEGRAKAIMNSKTPWTNALSLAGLPGGSRARFDKPMEVMDAQGRKTTMLQSKVTEKLEAGEPVRLWDDKEGADVAAMKVARTQLAAIEQDAAKLPAKMKPLAADRWLEYGKYLTGSAREDMARFFNDVKNATATFGGISQKMANVRAIAIFNAVNQHYPKINDSPEQLLGKADRLNFTLDMGLDALGLPELVQNPQRLKELKAQYGLDTIGSDTALAEAVGKVANSITPGSYSAPKAETPTAMTPPTPKAPVTGKGEAITPRYRITTGKLKGVIVDSPEALKQMIQQGVLTPDDEYEEGR